MSKKYFSNRANRYVDEDNKRPSEFSYGLSSPRSGGLEACLCANKLTYSKKCCKTYLINQGIGNIQSPYPKYNEPGRAFSSAFNYGFS
jgi:hypothetical protein